MRIHRVTRVEEWQELEKEWDRSVVQSATSSIFLLAPWLMTWWRNLADGRKLQILHAEDATGHVFVPLMGTTRGRGGTGELAFIGTPLVDYADVIAPPQAHGLLVSLLSKLSEDDWRSLHLREVPAETSPLPVLLPELYGRLGVRGALVGDTCECPYIPMQGTWPEFLRGLSGKMRKDLRRGEARLAERGDVSFTRRGRVTPTELEEMFALYGIRHESRVGRGMFEDPRMRRFFAELAERFSDLGWLDVSQLRLNGQLIAYRFGFVFAGRVSAWNTAFHPALTDAGPAQILLARVIESSLARGDREIDLLRGAGSYKLRWTDRTRPNRFFRLFRSRSEYVAKLGYRALRTQLRRAESRIPLLHELWVRVSKRVR